MAPTTAVPHPPRRAAGRGGHGRPGLRPGPPYGVGMPQSPNHPRSASPCPPPRRHGPRRRRIGGNRPHRAGPTWAPTSMPSPTCRMRRALRRRHDAERGPTGRWLNDNGVHTIAPMVRRGILFDVPRALGEAPAPAASCPGHEITAADLERAAGPAGHRDRPGDVVLVRSGWGSASARAGLHRLPSPACPAWRRQGPVAGGHGPAPVGADTIAFECIAPGAATPLLPAHRVLLVESGVNIIETHGPGGPGRRRRARVPVRHDAA